MLFYIAVTAGAITLAYWWFAGDREHALTRTATVLIIACPHALGLAIPLVIAISTSLGAQNGLLVKDRLALERARDLDLVVFDKTGTLTRGAPALSGVWPLRQVSARTISFLLQPPLKVIRRIRSPKAIAPRLSGAVSPRWPLPSSSLCPVEARRQC